MPVKRGTGFNFKSAAINNTNSSNTKSKKRSLLEKDDISYKNKKIDFEKDKNEINCSIFGHIIKPFLKQNIEDQKLNKLSMHIN
jgi:hypothetical protein